MSNNLCSTVSFLLAACLAADRRTHENEQRALANFRKSTSKLALSCHHDAVLNLSKQTSFKLCKRAQLPRTQRKQNTREQTAEDDDDLRRGKASINLYTS
jgi:hypothetical protein